MFRFIMYMYMRIRIETHTLRRKEYMKTKTKVFMTLGLSLTMAFGVFASRSLQPKEVKETKADGTVTLYLDISSQTWWASDSAELHAHYWGGSNGSAWPGDTMSLVAGSSTKYELEIPTGHTKVIFNRVNPADHSTVWNRTSRDGEGAVAIDLPADFTVNNQFNITGSGSGYDDGNYIGNWSLYTPPAAVYDVDTWVNGVKTTVQVNEGELPADPTTPYDKTFDGWYAESTFEHEVTAITSNTSVYAKFYTTAAHMYTLNVDAVSTEFADPHIYIWNSKGTNAAWPGVAVSNHGSIIIPIDAQYVINDGAEENAKQTPDLGLSSQYNGEILVIRNVVDGEGKYLAQYAKGDNVPVIEGYYISGEFSSNDCWSYEDSEQMTNTDQDGNVAYEMNFNLAVGDEFRVRSYYTDRTPYDQWAVLGEPEGGWAGCEYGQPACTDTEDPNYELKHNNFKATKAGYYDVYAKYVEGVFTYFVVEHVNTYTVTLTGIPFEGKAKETGTIPLGTQLAYAGSNYTPSIDWESISGRNIRGYYTDANCTASYIPHELDANTELFVKLTKRGIYVVGDAEFSGNNDSAWIVDGGAYLTDDVADTENNLFEGTIVIPDSADTVPVQVRPVQYVSQNPADPDAESAYNWNISYTVADCGFASKVGNNIEFTKGGTYAVYVNKSYVVYLSEGKGAFISNFNTSVGLVCDANGGTDLDDLKDVWGEMETAYIALSAAEKLEFTSREGGIDSGDEHGDAMAQMIAKYSYIVHKYGTSNFKDFIWGGTYSGAARPMASTIINDNMNMMFVIIALTASMAFVGLMIAKKRKRLVK